jgi:class 3 adenylate cyclase/tetratricopeptide (TPR) repeat protein
LSPLAGALGEMRCPSCTAENQSTAKFCVECGTAFQTPCTNCGFKNPPTARFCQECGASLTPGVASQPQVAAAPIGLKTPTADQPQSLEPHDIPEGERKTVTALFADIKGSTELMADLDPEEARGIIDPALRLMIDAVHRYDGYIVQSTGDGIFALFGAPVAHEDHPQRALYAALRMQEELRRYSTRLREAGNLPIEARVGVNTGEVVVRSISTGAGHSEYTPIGHTANLASRIQALAPTGSVAATDATRRLCEGYFTFKSLGPTRLKGLAEAVQVHETTGLGPLRTRLQRAAGRGLTRFVGRQAEIEAMKRAAELAQSGHGQVVAAMAEAGVGKSRLFHEFKAMSQSGWMVLEAFSVSHGKASAYLPVIDLLRSYFKIAPEDDDRTRREKVNGKVLTLDRSLEDALPYLLGVLGLIEGEDPLAQMDAQVKKRRTLEAIKRILLRESLNQPLTVIFEDLHWIDEETQALLNVLAEGIATSHILMLVNYRPEYTHHWGNKTYYTQLRLDALGKESAEEMLDALLSSGPSISGEAGSGLPLPGLGEGPSSHPLPGQGEGRGVGIAALKRLIIDKTEGNPFFMEEMVQALFEQGALVKNGTVTLTTPLAELKIPPTVQAILASRIDRLPPTEKELLQTLAVIGKEFPLGVVREASASPHDELERMLQHLQFGEFIYEQPAFPDLEYSFKHALTQEVAYNSVLTERRRLLHGRIGTAIEKLHANRLEDHLPELAHHFARSADTAKAVEYLLKAGQSAAQRSASQEALDRFEAGLRLLESLPAGQVRDQQELAIRVALARPMMEVRGLAAADLELNMKRARELCDQSGAPAMLAFQVLHGLWSHYWILANLEMARSLAGQILALGVERGEQIASLAGYSALGLTCAQTGEYRAAATSLEQGTEISERLLAGCPEPMLRLVMFPLVLCRVYLSWTLWLLGYPEQALRQIDRLHALPQRLCSPNDTATIILGDLVTRGIYLRDYRGWREKAEAIAALARENGLSIYEAYGSLLLGHAAAREGTIHEGIEAMLQGTETCRAAGEVLNFHFCKFLVAAALLSAGRSSEGLVAVDEAIAAADQLQLLFGGAELHRLKGELLLLAGAPESEAEASMRRAIAVAQRQEAKSWALRAATSLARLLRKQGRIGEAQELLAPVYNWFTEGFETADLKDAKALLEELGV